MDRVDADVVTAMLHRRRLGQGADRAFRGIVADMDMMLAGDAGNRRDVDDRPAAGRLHDRNREFHPQEDAARIDRHQAIPSRGFEQLPESPASLTRMSSL